MSGTGITFQFQAPSQNVSRTRTQSRMSQLSATPSSRRNSSPAPTITLSRHNSGDDDSESQYGQFPPDSFEMSDPTHTGPPAPTFRFQDPRIAAGESSEDAELGRTTNGVSRNRTQAATIYTENKDLKRCLGVLDVAALIMNKMIGAGFFTTPGTVLFLTQSKRLSIVLWVVGGIYSMISFSIYLEYGLNFRYNGGDLIYLDEVWPRPELLSTVLYSGFFLCFGHTAGNSVAFAKYALAAANSQLHKTTQFDSRLVCFIAITILTVICLLHYFSATTGLFLNKILAWYKTGLLLTVFVAGVIAKNNPGSGKDDWGTSDTPHSNFSTLSAMIYILYSYQGWENANYVGGEIKVDKPTLQLGGFIAVITTTILYVLATVGYYLACSFDTITGKDSDLGMGQYFAEQAFGGHTVGFKSCIALSAVGNVIAVVFTSSKVKQSIARQRIIPFYDFFGNDDKQFGTPAGALILHWIFTVIVILAMPDTTDGYSFVIGAFTYGHLIVGLFIGVGVWKLKRRMTGYKQLETWDYKFLTAGWFRHPVVFLFLGVNCLVLYVAATPHAAGSIPRKWWPIILLGILVPVSLVYWAVLWLIQKDKSGQDRAGAKLFGATATVHHPDPMISRGSMSEFEKMMMDARKDGSNRRVIYTVDGKGWKRLNRWRKYLMEKFYSWFL